MNAYLIISAPLSGESVRLRHGSLSSAGKLTRFQHAAAIANYGGVSAVYAQLGRGDISPCPTVV